MARLVAVCKDGEEEYQFLTRQIPLYIDDDLTMVMELPDSVDHVDDNIINSPSFKQFSMHHSKLIQQQDLSVALRVMSRELYSSLTQLVSCVGCRRSVEKLYSHMIESGSPALEPLTVESTGLLSFTKSCLTDVKKLYTLFYVHGPKVNDLIEAIPKSKKNKRCQLHSLDTHKPKTLGVNWLDVWGLMSEECRKEVLVLDSECLLEAVEDYILKYRFCPECKNKVLRAYNILVGTVDKSKEKDYSAALYEGLFCCPRHVHLNCETDFIARLLGRAEPEYSGKHELRERHAKTIDDAQEEVLICIGVHLYERLNRIWQKLQAEEQTWQVLFHLGIDALRKGFEIAIEKLEGVSRLEQFCEKLSEEERAKELKLEKKRRKKKNRLKNKLQNETASETVLLESVESGCQGCESNNEEENSCQDRITTEIIPCRCSGKTKPDSSLHSNGSDCGYSSSSEIGSRVGSDVACSDGICNHDETENSTLRPCLTTQKSDCDFKISFLDDQEYSEAALEEESGLTKDEIQSFIEKNPTFYKERILNRKHIKEKFHDYCATVRWKSN